MSVVPIGHAAMTAADVSAIIARGKVLTGGAGFGSWVEVESRFGEAVVALLDSADSRLAYAFGKRQGRYYVLDRDGRCLAAGRFIDDVLAILQ